MNRNVVLFGDCFIIGLHAMGIASTTPIGLKYWDGDN